MKLGPLLAANQWTNHWPNEAQGVLFVICCILIPEFKGKGSPSGGFAEKLVLLPNEL